MPRQPVHDEPRYNPLESNPTNAEERIAAEAVADALLDQMIAEVKPWELLNHVKTVEKKDRARHYDSVIGAISREPQHAERQMLSKEAAAVFGAYSQGQILRDVAAWRTSVAAPPLTPWETEVDGAAWLDTVAGLLRRYVVLPPHADTALALWALWTFAFDAFDTAPILTITSPLPRCGKTTVTGLLTAIVHRPLMASSVTAAVIYRVIEQRHPTLLIDEVDSFLSLHEEMRGILNSGHQRDGARVLRSVGDEHEPRDFSTWCPKVLALIKR
jgi:hypothetical protein